MSSKRGRHQSDNKRQYFHNPIPMTENPDEQAVVKWWQKLSPDERLDIISATAAQRVPEPKPRLEYARCRIPLPDDPAQRAVVEQFRNLTPTQRLAKFKTFIEVH